MCTNNNQKIFNFMLSNKRDSTMLDGWTIEKFNKLTKLEQDWFVQFAKEYVGNCSKKDRKLFTEQELTDSVAYRQYRRMTQVGNEPVFLEVSLWESIPATDGGNPESQVIAAQEFQQKLNRKEKRAETLYKTFNKL